MDSIKKHIKAIQKICLDNEKFNYFFIGAKLDDEGNISSTASVVSYENEILVQAINTLMNDKPDIASLLCEAVKRYFSDHFSHMNDNEEEEEEEDIQDEDASSPTNKRTKAIKEFDALVNACKELNEVIEEIAESLK